MEGSLCWGDHPVLFGWIIDMASYDWQRQGRGEDRWSPGCRKWGQGVTAGDVAG